MEDRILVVDDDKSMLKTLDNLLSKEGYNVTAISSSHAASKKIKKESFDLIILDIRMPKMDGISLLKKIRKAQKLDDTSRVIIITAYASEETPIKALKLGADDYIMKPFDVSDFLRSVSMNLKICHMRRDMMAIDKLHYKLEKDVARMLKKYRECMELENG